MLGLQAEPKSAAASDQFRSGITGVVKSIHLAEAFNMKYELHHGGNSLNDFELIRRMTIDVLR